MGITYAGYEVTCDECGEEAPGTGWRNLQAIKRYARTQENWRFGVVVLCGWCYENNKNIAVETEKEQR